MNTRKLLAYVSLLTFAFQSCNQEDAFDCVKSTGSLSTEERNLAIFRTIILEDNIDLQLTTQTPGTAVVEAGKNLISKIDLSYTGDTLIISNKNTCEWARSYKHPVTVTLGIAPESLKLVHQGYGKITSVGTLFLPDLYILSLDAGGNIDIAIQTTSFNLYSNSQALISLIGQSNNASIWLNKAIGRVHAENFEVQSYTVTHEGSNEIRVFPKKEL